MDGEVYWKQYIPVSIQKLIGGTKQWSVAAAKCVGECDFVAGGAKEGCLNATRYVLKGCG